MERTIFALILVATFISGCATPHYTEMILYKHDSKQGDFQLPKNEITEEVPPYGVPNYLANNPIFVRKGAKFSIELEQVNPGWLHHDKDVTAPKVTASCSSTDVDESGRTINPCNVRNERLTKDQTEHINGKELWIVTRIFALTANSPLELEGKTYFKVSNVKFGTQSFRSVPLDISESQIFTHQADLAYRISIKVYEVDSFALKRALVKTQRDNPGVTGMLLSAWKTVMSTVGSLAGDMAISGLKSLLRTENLQDPLLVESILLQSGGTLELAGTAHVYTREYSGAPADEGWLSESRYLLYDKWKSEPEWDFSFGGGNRKKEYLKAQEATEGTIVHTELTAQKSYVLLRLVESVPQKEAVQPTEAIAKGGEKGETLAQQIKAHQDRPND